MNPMLSIIIFIILTIPTGFIHIMVYSKNAFYSAVLEIILIILLIILGLVISLRSSPGAPYADFSYQEKQGPFTRLISSNH